MALCSIFPVKFSLGIFLRYVAKREEKTLIRIGHHLIDANDHKSLTAKMQFVELFLYLLSGCLESIATLLPNGTNDLTKI